MMGFLKKQWRWIVFAVVGLCSAGGGAWAWLGGAAVMEQMEAVNRLRGDVEALRRNPVNARVIEDRRKKVEEANAAFERAMNAALSVQANNAFESTIGPDGKAAPKPRTLLLPNALPRPSKADRIDFKEAYRQAFARLKQRLGGRDRPSALEVREYEARQKQLQSNVPAQVSINPWLPREGEEAASTPGKPRKRRTLAEIVKDYPRARAAEDVARSIPMYVSDSALTEHRVTTLEVPTEVDIWQAQMGLWIQQDLVSVLAGMNEARARQLEREGRRDQVWVAYMPVKHLLALRIAPMLGNGGGLNTAGAAWAPSFTGVTNSEKMFTVTMQLEVVVEAAQLAALLDGLCRVGFYTPVAVTYESVPPNPLQEDYLYGEQPVIRVKIDLEGYYFRKVFDQWIPDVLKPVMKLANAMDPTMKTRP
jgi:hypothetical protein